jgi:hypothetical protein
MKGLGCDATVLFDMEPNGFTHEASWGEYRGVRFACQSSGFKKEKMNEETGRLFYSGSVFFHKFFC